MMRSALKYSIILVLMFSIFACSRNEPKATETTSAIKKYNVKSGNITFNSVSKAGDTEMKSKQVVYFDDFGIKECKETYEDGTLTESVFSDGQNRYSVYHTKKIASKDGAAIRGTELRVAFEEMGTKEDRDSGKVKKIAPITIAGKQCEAVEVKTGSDTLTRFAGWNGVMVYMKLESKRITTTIEAEKIEENAAVNQDKFKIPAGFTVQ